MLPPPDITDALFLDFDGTLVEIAASPSQVVVPQSLLELLRSARERVSGALAIVSGRPIESLDRLLAPLNLAAAGEHGCEIRFRAGDIINHTAPLPAAVAKQMADLAARLPGTEAEIKTASAAVHFRRAPDAAPEVMKAVKALADNLDGYELLRGKMVAELKPAHINKGVAIRIMAARAPFFGRRLVYIGDDVTDEAAFIAVNELGGISIRAGLDKGTSALYCVDGVRDVHAWLRQLI